MTMPSKIWYGRDPVYGSRDKVWKPEDVKRYKVKEPKGVEWQNITLYIRADLADDLARALEATGYDNLTPDAQCALTAYHSTQIP